jgi:hypothetical protein
MLDLSLNSDFSVFLDDNGDLATVSGREEFEQSVVIMMTELIRNSVIGQFDQSTIEQKLKLEATRVARSHDKLTEISRIDVSPHPENPHTYVVSIDYKTDEFFEGEISE